jgi:hypothetical protein
MAMADIASLSLGAALPVANAQNRPRQINPISTENLTLRDTSRSFRAFSA